MKKLGFFVTLLLVLCLALCAAPALADVSLGTATVNNPQADQWLNLRQSPTTQSESLGGYYSGVQATILEYTNNDWMKVQIGSLTGYMMRSYLATNGQYVYSAIPTYKAVTTFTLKNYPSTASTLGDFYAGSTIELLGFCNDWWHVRVNGNQTGFISVYGAQAAFQQVSGNYYAGYRTAVVNNPITTQALNLRESATTSSKSIGLYYNGVVVAVTGNESNGWVPVRIGYRTGYMMTKYLKMDALSGAVTSGMRTMWVSKASGKRLNLRAGDTVNSDSLGLYDGGTQVTVMGYSDKWCHVMVNGQVGFMMKEYLTTATYGNATATPYAPVVTPVGPATPTATPAPGGTKLDNVDSDGSWKGPQGSHTTASWPYAQPTARPDGTTVLTATVVNPNPNDRLHLRVWGSSSAASVGKYYTGVRAEVLDNTDETWVKVLIGNDTGYMMRKFLAFGDAQNSVVSAMPVMTVNNYNGSYVHLYEGKGTQYTSLGQYNNGTQVILMGFESTWAHVIVDGKMGYILGKYLK